MSTQRFDAFFEWLVPWEGSTFEDDPADHGGATKFGIDQRSHPNVDIRNLSKEGAKSIYRVEYWCAVKADIMPLPLDWVVTDIAVNNGKSRAIKWLQEALGLNTDGIIGPITLKAIRDCNGRSIAAYLINKRDAFYKSIAKGNQAKFLKGWLARNNDLADKMT